MVLLFPPRHVYFPATAAHTSTVILLHGRGSSGSELASDLAEAHTSGNKTLFAHFPSTRWVFPSARRQWSDRWKVEISEWFDLVSLEDPDSEPKKQVPGLRESVEYILRIIEEEVARLDGNSDRVVLGGFSQGMAVAMAALVCCRKRLGGFVGAMGWIPFASRLASLLDQGEVEKAAGFYRWSLGFTSTQQKSLRAKSETASPFEAAKQETTVSSSLQTPIFLGHQVHDKWVDVRLGETARETLSRLGFQVCWKTYQDGEGDGHWLKEPEQFDDIVLFLEKSFS
jgi:lysophospholipase II